MLTTLEPSLGICLLSCHCLRDIPVLHKARPLEPQLVHNHLIEFPFDKLSIMHMTEAPSSVGSQIGNGETWSVDEYFQKGDRILATGEAVGVVLDVLTARNVMVNIRYIVIIQSLRDVPRNIFIPSFSRVPLSQENLGKVFDRCVLSGEE